MRDPSASAGIGGTLEALLRTRANSWDDFFHRREDPIALGWQQEPEGTGLKHRKLFWELPAGAPFGRLADVIIEGIREVVLSEILSGFERLAAIPTGDTEG